MVGSAIKEAKDPAPLTVGIAIDGKKNSTYLLNWALDKFASEENVAFKLLHVRPAVTSVPTPMGNSIPIARVREDIAAAYRKEIEWRTIQRLLPFNNFCIRRKVKVEVVAIESDNVVNAIKEEITKSNIKKLVIGVARSGLLTRKIRKSTLSSRISASVPTFCTVYAVSKGKLLSIRPSDEDTNGSSRDNSSASSSSTGDSSSCGFSTQSDFASFNSFSMFSSTSLPIHLQRFRALSTINKGPLLVRTNSVDINHKNSSYLRCQSLPIEERNYAESLLNQSSSCKSSQANQSERCSSDYSENIKFELEKLRIELRHIRGMHAVAQSKAIDASRKLKDLNNRHNEESTKLKEIEQREDLVTNFALQETKKREAATEEAEYTWQRAQREAARREEAERRATRHAKEKEKLESAIQGSVDLYKKYTWHEIESATSSFSEKFKIGMGANGTVYKCDLHHTTAAVKILHSKENSDFKQLQKEIEVLSKVRHPNLLSLLGACPDKGCLIYEYMENGNLEERLLRSNKTPPIPWFERFRIAWEIASALVFLHNAKPTPIVHRDLKPANILLDRNFVSKIGDVGLSAIIQSDGSHSTTCPVGTICYIDPEYQRTGLISPKSDAYAFGIVILQLLTAKSAMGLQRTVESAIEGGSLLEILDQAAGDWPRGETRELATLGLSCAELRRRDRPDLEEEVLPVLERLKGVADEARGGALRSRHVAPPGHFLCPIVKEVMMEPSVAADGYTYEREAIEKWMEEDERSPVTTLPLGNKNLVPNYALLSAIMEWKSNNQ